jgi:alpha-amylase/alpha-mannosidase (GH57 family)
MKLCILWHMHQPDYRIPGAGGRAAMPWVRLHAAKDYMDMARLAEEAPANVQTTFNLTPCLLEQLHELASGTHGDAFLDVARKNVKDWSEAERQFALAHFFSANEDRQIRTLPRYAELNERRARTRTRAKLLETFNDDDFRDLTVLFHLAWSGQWLRRHETVARLVTKGRRYSEDEKNALLALQDEQARAIMPLYGQLARDGRIEISTTPLYHPIVPLLIDLRTATESRPECHVDGIDFRWPEDAKLQLELGLERTEKHLGWRPHGMWPSEGSLSEPALELIGQAGVEWCATDEQNLRRSLGIDARPGSHLRPWRLRGQGPAIFFRDTQLSDLIGFTYSRWDASRAADDLIARAVATAQAHEGPGEPIVPVILDGENAWEFYAENGETFLHTLYERLGNTPGLQATTFARALETAEPGRLGRLAPGSWIYGNFDTWAGHPEKNRAWQLLAGVRREVEDATKASGKPLPDDVREVLLRAEGSDWFWWLGDDHPTAYLAEFDALFRLNLAWVLEKIGREGVVPLDEPIARRAQVTVAVEQPLALISPKIDGLAVRYYEWVGSGIYRPIDEGAAMKLTAEACVSQLRFGFDAENLYLRIDPKPTSPKGELRAALMRFNFETPLGQRTYEWSQDFGIKAVDGTPEGGADAACVNVLEVALPREPLGLAPGGRARMTVELQRSDERREVLPRDGAIELLGPDEHFDNRNWTL